MTVAWRLPRFGVRGLKRAAWLRAGSLCPAVLLWAVLIGCAKAPIEPAQPYNVLLLTVDTLRADHLGCYGYAPIETPLVDELASQGFLFENAYTVVPITTPSFASIMTSQFPRDTGLRVNGGFSLHRDFTTLAEVLQAQGYLTAAFVAAYPLAAKFGINQGFETYGDDFSKKPEMDPRYIWIHHPGSFVKRAYQISNEGIEWLENRPTQPFLLWLHYFDPHDPYLPPPPFEERYQSQPYDGEIAYVDSQLSRVLQALERLGLRENTLIVFFSDHGESLRDHDFQSHGPYLYESSLHVPLIFVCPNLVPSGQRSTSLVSTLDIMPTILELCGIGYSLPAESGRSLVPLFSGGPLQEIPVYAESFFFMLQFPFAAEGGRVTGSFTGMMRKGNHKLIMTHSDTDHTLEWTSLFPKGKTFKKGLAVELYDLESDPGETRNLGPSQPQLARQMLRQLQQNYFSKNPQTVYKRTVPMDEEDVESLKALGYMK